MKKTRRTRRVSPSAGKSLNVTRAEFDSLKATVVEVLDALTRIREDLGVQFTRIAQLQAEIDRVRAQVARRRTK